ncbi:MAG: IS1595 family transposase [Acidimicrobiia bacterium]|nr:IS1595 family transposase [Acidimicrobiia bacterium]
MCLIRSLRGRSRWRSRRKQQRSVPDPPAGGPSGEPSRSRPKAACLPGHTHDVHRLNKSSAQQLAHSRLANASAASLHPFITADVEPGTTVITDAWQGYSGINELGYRRDRRSQRAARQRGDDPFALLPGVHRVASLAKRWLLGTHQGSVDEAHLQSYLDEFVFRFNRRTSRNRGLVFHRVLALAVGHQPVRYRDLIINPQPKLHPPAGRAGWGHPPTLDRPPAHRPWRTS